MFLEVIVLGNLKFPGTPRSQVQDFSPRGVVTPDPGVFSLGQPRDIKTLIPPSGGLYGSQILLFKVLEVQMCY